MNSLIIHPEYSNLKEKLENFKAIITEKIAEKDDLIFHECKSIETIYMLKLGHLEYKIFEIKLNIRKTKRKISLIQKKINLQKEIDLNLIENIVEIEFEKYILELEEKGAQINIALNRAENKRLSKEETLEIKKLYKELILKLHPDLNDNISEKEQDLFFKVMEAFENADLEKLKVLKVLTSDISKDAGVKEDENILDKLKKDIDLLEIRCDLIDKEIIEIKSSYPYNKKDLINNEEKLEENRKIFEENLDYYLEDLSRYKEKLDNLVKSIS